MFGQVILEIRAKILVIGLEDVDPAARVSRFRWTWLVENS